MAHGHDPHGHSSTTTVYEGDREGPATALIVLIVLAALALLIWFFAFSGVVFDRDSGGDGGTTVNNEQQIEDNTDTTNTDPGTGSVPSPGGTGG